MDATELRRLKPELESFLDRYGGWLLMALIGLAILPGLLPQASGLPNPLGDLVNGLVGVLVGA